MTAKNAAAALAPVSLAYANGADLLKLAQSSTVDAMVSGLAAAERGAGGYGVALALRYGFVDADALPTDAELAARGLAVSTAAAILGIARNLRRAVGIAGDTAARQGATRSLDAAIAARVPLRDALAAFASSVRVPEGVEDKASMGERDKRAAAKLGEAAAATTIAKRAKTAEQRKAERELAPAKAPKAPEEPAGERDPMKVAHGAIAEAIAALARVGDSTKAIRAVLAAQAEAVANLAAKH